MFKAGLLDVDGVILDSEEMYYQAVRETFLPYGVDLTREDYARCFLIDTTGTARVIRDYGLDVDIAKVRVRKAAIVDRMIDSGLETIDGAVDMVKRLHASYPLGVVTSADRRELDKKFGRFDLQKYFSVIVTSSDVENRKPHPEPYARGVERLQKYVQVSPVEVFVVEDNPSGVLSAKAAGCTVIACPNGPTKGMRFPGADAIVKGLAEIDGDFLRALWLRT